MCEIINIEAGKTYVVKGDTLTYNGVTYNVADTFVGVDGVSDYTGDGCPFPVLIMRMASIESYVYQEPEINSTFHVEMKVLATETFVDGQNIHYPDTLDIRVVTSEINTVLTSKPIIIYSIN